MIPRDQVIHEGNDTEPEFTWGSLYTLLQIATDPTCREVCHAGPRHFYSVLHKPQDLMLPCPVVRLTLNELIKKTMPVFKEIDLLHDKVTYYKQDARNIREQCAEQQREIDLLKSKLDAINEVINPE